jgi:hypothetical protein
MAPTQYFFKPGTLLWLLNWIMANKKYTAKRKWKPCVLWTDFPLFLSCLLCKIKFLIPTVNFALAILLAKLHLCHSEVLHFTHTVYLCVLCESLNKQRLLPDKALTYWVLITELDSVYCAVRTGFLKQLPLVLKGLKTITWAVLVREWLPHQPVNVDSYGFRYGNITVHVCACVRACVCVCVCVLPKGVIWQSLHSYYKLEKPDLCPQYLPWTTRVSIKYTVRNTRLKKCWPFFLHIF